MGQWRECSDLAPPPSPEAEAAGEAAVARRSSMKNLFRSLRKGDAGRQREQGGRFSSTAAAPRACSPPGCPVGTHPALLCSLHTPLWQPPSFWPFVRGPCRRPCRSPADTRASLSAASARPGAPPRSTTLQSVDEEGLLEAGSSGALRASPFSACSIDLSCDDGGPSSPSLGGEPSLPGAMLLPEGSTAGLSQQEDSYVVPPPPGPASPGYGSSSSPERQPSPQRLQQEFQQLTDMQCQRALDAEFGHSAEAPPAPPVDPGMQHVLVRGAGRLGGGEGWMGRSSGP